jgi:hypothetical protein
MLFVFHLAHWEYSSRKIIVWAGRIFINSTADFWHALLHSLCGQEALACFVALIVRPGSSGMLCCTHWERKAVNIPRIFPEALIAHMRPTTPVTGRCSGGGSWGRVRHPRCGGHTSLVWGGICRGRSRREAGSCLGLARVLWVPGQVLAVLGQDECRWDTARPMVLWVPLDISAVLDVSAVLQVHASTPATESCDPWLPVGSFR